MLPFTSTASGTIVVAPDTGRSSSLASVGGVASTGESVWATLTTSGLLIRIDPGARTVVRTIAVGAAPVGVAASGDSVWVANSGDGTISRIDATTNSVVATIRLGGRPQGTALGANAAWVTVR